MAANDERTPGFGGTNGYGMFVPKHGVYTESETQAHPLGTVLRLGGRTFVYAQASEALSKGKLTTQLQTTFTEDTVTVAHPAGTRKVTITASAAISADQLVGGLLVVDEGTGAGESYLIKSNPAISNGATGVIELHDGLMTAWATADTDITIYTSPYRVQESNTDQIETPAGVPLISVTDEYYFWLCTWGPVGVLIDATGTFGNATNERVGCISGAVAGAVAKLDAAGEAPVGYTMGDAADYTDAQYAAFYLTLQR